ncbi:MAG: HEAT repeat domain-containing protein [Promethearchaeota archaeon]
MSVSALLEQIKSKDNEAKLLAIKRLGMIYDDDRIIDPLLTLLLDKNAKIRETTILSLSTQSQTEKIIRPIINCLKDEEVNVQLAAIRALSEFRSIIATKPLIKILSDTNSSSEIRAGTVLALGLIEDKNSLFPLIDCLDDEFPQVRINALSALSHLGDPRAIDPIIELLQKEKDENVQQMAILALGPLGQNNERIIDPLIKFLSDPNPRVRQYAIVSLGQTHDPRIIEPLLKVINDKDPYVRQVCASSLSEIQDPKTITQFILRLKDENEEIRETAARALGKLADVNAIPALIEALNDNNATVRDESCVALGQLSDSKAIKPLISIIKKDADPQVRQSAAIAIGKIECLNSSMSAFLNPSSAMRALNKALSDKEIPVRTAAAESLAKISLTQHKFAKAQSYFEKASKESLTWEFRQPFYEASAIGCKILDQIAKKTYKKSDDEFETIYSNIQNAAKMIGAQAFISKNFWAIIEVYNKIFLSTNKSQFVQEFRDLGLKILLLAKKLPEGEEHLIDLPQDRLNEKFQVIDKRGLPLEDSLTEMENLKDEIFNIGIKILQIEPLELRLDEDQEFTINKIESLNLSSQNTPIINGFGDGSLFKEEEELIQRAATQQKEKKNFIIEEISLTADPFMFAGEEVQIGLIQYLKGSPRLNLIEDPRDIWERTIQRYYDYEVFRKSHLIQFTKEAIQMRAKPKIIGYLDDLIYENCKLVIFPECSMPESYLPKLQQFSTRFNVFIIAGVENIATQGHYYNRSYILCPDASQFWYQQENNQQIYPASERFPEEWHENVEPTAPPVFRIFTSPFGRFLILIGQDIKDCSQYLTYIAREKNLDFVILLNNGFETETSYQAYQKMADEVQKPIFYVNTGQFGGTGVYTPNGHGKTSLQQEYCEGRTLYSHKVPGEPIPKDIKAKEEK